MGLDEDEGGVFESAGIGGGSRSLLGEEGGSGSAGEEDVVHLVELGGLGKVGMLSVDMAQGRWPVVAGVGLMWRSLGINDVIKCTPK